MRDKLESKELEDFIENHYVIYIRHFLLSTRQLYQKLISDGIVAVHYGESLKKGVDAGNLKNHEDPQNYEDGIARKVMNRLKRYCEDGVVVFADYSDPNYSDQKMANMGIIQEGEHYKAVPYYEGNDLFVYKQIGLCNYKPIAYADFTQFLAIHPRGGTVIRWHAEKPVKFIYKKELGLPIDPESTNFEVLFPAQQEVLCSEYLRMKAPNEIRLKHFLLPIGRGMKAVDIDGINDFKRVFAQVSFSRNKKEVKDKAKELENLAKDYRGSKELIRVYFGPKETERFVHQVASDIMFVSLEEVFAAMKNTEILNVLLGMRTA